jgi:hypothetical protein
MDDFGTVGDRINKFFKKKYPDLEIKSIGFKERVNLEFNKRSYEIEYDFERKGKWVGSLLPTHYSSKVSFEKAFEKSKIMVEAYFKLVKIDEQS